MMPTEAQKKAGNYAKKHIFVGGLDISIENTKGSIRSGTDESGHAWSVRIPCDYGYIKRTTGRDGDNVDVFVGPYRDSEYVVAVNQYAKAGYFDEHKFMLGFHSLKEAQAAYKASYTISMKAEFVPTTLQRFKTWLSTKNVQNRFHLSSKLTLTSFDMKPTRNDENKPKERSKLAKVMTYVGPAATLVGALAWKRAMSGRPNPTRTQDPTKLTPKQTAINKLFPEDAPYHRPKLLVHTDPKIGSDSSLYVTAAQHRGESAPVYSTFHKGAKFKPTGGTNASAETREPTIVPFPKEASAQAPVAQPAPSASTSTHANSTAQDHTTDKPWGSRKVMVGGKPNRKSKIVKNSAGIDGVVYFNDQAAGNLMGSADSVGYAFRKGRRLIPWLKRGQQTAEDVGDMASGRKVKDPFYKKNWFKYAAAGAGVGAGVFGARRINALAHQQKDFPNSIPAIHPMTGRLQERALVAAQKLDKRLPDCVKLTHPAGPLFSARVKQVQLASALPLGTARVRQIMFDLSADEKGWDLRDARGRSARVYAPGSRRRDRRDKTWDEKTDNLRMIRNVAIGAAIAGGIGTLHYRNKWKTDVSPVDTHQDVLDKVASSGGKILAIPGMGRKVTASARVSTIEFARNKSNTEHKDSTTRKIIRGAGIATAVGGAALLPAAIPMLRTQLISKKDPVGGGKFVTDYLKSGQALLNSGPQGYVSGKVIQHARSKTKSGTLPRFMADHYARFRAGPKEALGHWGYEVGESLYQNSIKAGIKNSISPEVAATRAAAKVKPFVAAQSKAQDAINQRLWHQGENEIEAIASVGKDPKHAPYFNRLAAHKSDASKGYAKKSLVAPAAVLAGVGAYAVARPQDEENKRPIHFSSLHKVYDAVGNNIEVSRPEIPGEDVARTILQNKKSRSFILRGLGATVVTAGGALAGHVAKRPIVGAMTGGLLGGMILAH